MKLKTRAPARALKRANGKLRRNAWKLGHQGQIRPKHEQVPTWVSRKVWRESEHRRLHAVAGMKRFLGIGLEATK